LSNLIGNMYTISIVDVSDSNKLKCLTLGSPANTASLSGENLVLPTMELCNKQNSDQYWNFTKVATNTYSIISYDGNILDGNVDFQKGQNFFYPFMWYPENPPTLNHQWILEGELNPIESASVLMTNVVMGGFAFDLEFINYNMTVLVLGTEVEKKRDTTLPPAVPIPIPPPPTIGDPLMFTIIRKFGNTFSLYIPELNYCMESVYFTFMFHPTSLVMMGSCGEFSLWTFSALEWDVYSVTANGSAPSAQGAEPIGLVALDGSGRSSGWPGGSNYYATLLAPENPPSQMQQWRLQF